MSLLLSKSRYCAAIQCPKMLWLSQNKPDAFASDSVDQSAMETGTEVGKLAMGLFGDYVKVPFGGSNAMAEETNRLIDAEIPVIAEASFLADDLFCSVDILRNMGNREVELYEVKSSTSVQEIYLHDAAFQVYVLTKAGYTVKSCCIVHIDNRYERCGDLNIFELFTTEEITERVMDMQDDVAANITRIRAYMEQTEEPSDDIGQHCFSPYGCDFFPYCTRHLPKPNVFDVAGARTSTKLKCYHNGHISFEQLNTCDALSAAQYKQIEHELFGYPPSINASQIRSFMKDLTYPLYFLDFESFQPAIPLFDHSHPYEQIVFQYSLHYIEQEGGELQHKEYLAYPGSDPRRALAEQLCADIPLDVCTTAYNMGFEKGRIRGLAELYPDLRDHLMNIHDHIQDLMIPFQKKWYYCRAMKGSYSIKYVLPALFPDDPALDYHNLEGVHNGGEASETYARMASMSPQELETARRHLLQYCGLDTFAMVKVWQKLCEIIL